jgi:hypothetical protein
MAESSSFSLLSAKKLRAGEKGKVISNPLPNHYDAFRKPL